MFSMNRSTDDAMSIASVPGPRDHAASGSLLTFDALGSKLLLGSRYSKESRETQDLYRCDNHELDYFTAHLFATSLDEAITCLKINEETNNDMRVSVTKMSMDKLIPRKYGVEEIVTTDELAGIDPKNITAEVYKLNKLVNDRKNIREVLQGLCVDLISRLNFRLLVSKCKALDVNAVQLQGTTTENVQYKNILRDLKHKLRSEQKKNRIAIYDSDTEIDNLKRQISNKDLQLGTELRYCERWQNARQEQHKKLIDDVADSRIDNIRIYKEQREDDHRVHAEITRYNRIVIDERHMETDDVMTKYEIDMEKIDLALQVVRSKYREMLDQRIFLERKIKKHAEMMKDWIQFKIDREKANEYSRNMQASAIIVQAWWRGFIVRHELGPFRPPKKGRGKKGKRAAGANV